MKVFLVDDSKIFRFTVKKMFSVSGFDGELVEFEDGQFAYNFISEHFDKPDMLPDLILLDINMPVMSGWDFLEAIRDLKASKPLEIRILSSSIDPMDIERSKEFNQVDGYLTKPLNLETIKEIMNEFGKAA